MLATLQMRANSWQMERRRARTLEWINEWRVAHARVPLRDLRKGVRGSRRHGIIARNMEVLAYEGGVWSDRAGGCGDVPSYVAQFARDFDAGCYDDLAGRLVPFSSSAHEMRAAQGLPWAESHLVT